MTVSAPAVCVLDALGIHLLFTEFRQSLNASQALEVKSTTK